MIPEHPPKLEDREAALAKLLQVSTLNVEALPLCGKWYDEFLCNGRIWCVLDGFEAHRYCAELMDAWITANILPDIPEKYRAFFDFAKYRKETLSAPNGPRKEIVAWDGEEWQVTWNSRRFYVYCRYPATKGTRGRRKS